MTEITVSFTDKIINWYQSASTLTGFMWIEVDGIVVGGSQVNPTAAVPAQTSDTLADLTDYIKAAMQELTGDVPQAYAYPTPPGFLTYGVSNLPYGNTKHMKELIAIGSKNTYTFGALNIPARLNGEVLKIRTYIYADFANANLMSPAVKDLEAYITANSKLPVLNVLELNAR